MIAFVPYSRLSLIGDTWLDAGPSREFRVVRDNRHSALENRSEVGHKGSTYMPVSERRYDCPMFHMKLL